MPNSLVRDLLTLNLVCMFAQPHFLVFVCANMCVGTSENEDRCVHACFRGRMNADMCFVGLHACNFSDNGCSFSDNGVYDCQCVCGCTLTTPHPYEHAPLLLPSDNTTAVSPPRPRSSREGVPSPPAPYSKKLDK